MHLAEIIHLSDPRAWKCNEAKIKELEGLVKSMSWKIVCREERPPAANILNSRCVLAIKDEAMKEKIWKARHVIQGDRDSMNSFYFTTVQLQDN